MHFRITLFEAAGTARISIKLMNLTLVANRNEALIDSDHREPRHRWRLFFFCAGSFDMPTTKITASATVIVRGANTPQTASAVATMLGEALGQAMTAAGAANAPATLEAKR